jgi:hypothetical protein
MMVNDTYQSQTVAIDILFSAKHDVLCVEMYFLLSSLVNSKLIFLPLPFRSHCTLYNVHNQYTSTSKSGSIKKSRLRFQSTTIPLFCALFGVLPKLVIFCLKEVKFVVGHTGCVVRYQVPVSSKSPKKP